MAGMSAKTRPEVPIAELRDYACCPYMWWLRNAPLSLWDQEQLQIVKQDPGMGRRRTVPFEIEKTGTAWLLTIAFVATGIIFWIVSGLTKQMTDIAAIADIFFYIGTLLQAYAIVSLVRWYRWRVRTPGFDRPKPGRMLYEDTGEGEPVVFHAPGHGICGRLHYVTRYKQHLAVMEFRCTETPRFLSAQDRMQAVAEALLAETEFRERPKYAYVVFPDRTFTVKIVAQEVQPVLDAVNVIRSANATGQMPDALPAWNLCPGCPIPDCPKRMGERKSS
jgi:hypothetical protein